VAAKNDRRRLGEAKASVGRRASIPQLVLGTGADAPMLACIVVPLHRSRGSGIRDPLRQPCAVRTTASDEAEHDRCDDLDYRRHW
jgi:hypothetical protein